MRHQGIVAADAGITDTITARVPAPAGGIRNARSGQLNQPQAMALAAMSEAPPDQALRLRRIREICPGIEITRCGPWQAVIPEPDGERTVIRWELAEFLDRLDVLLMAGLPQASR
jgi:hypothetical protein